MQLRAYSVLLASCLLACEQPVEPSDVVVEPPPAADPGPFAVLSVSQGPTPFIAFVRLRAVGFDGASTLDVTVAPRPGAAAAPVTAHYSRDWLARRGYASEAPVLRVPVYGLYDGAPNSLTLRAHLADGTLREASTTLVTSAFSPLWKNLAQTTVAPEVALGFDFFLIKSPAGPPLVMDRDGRLRWAGIGVAGSGPTRFTGGGFTVGDATAPVLHRLELDGTASSGALAADGYTNFHHDLTAGKTGLLAEVDVTRGGRTQVESVFAEVDTAGTVLREWSLGDIVARTMREGGDDPSAFVRDGVDWFHLNSVFYDAQDDALLVSSRENFVMKLDYETGDVIWLFGDPTKYWATFPSLARKALALAPGGVWPIGQHAVSLTPERHLLLFDDGTPSVNQPADAPAGASLPSSLVVAYSIDAASGTATQAFRFDHEPALSSAYCSSAYQVADGSMLVDYSMAGGDHAVLVGLDPARRTAFEVTVPTIGCSAAWNAEPIAFGEQSFE